MDPLSIAGLIVGICALVQAALYNHSAKKLNKQTEKIQAQTQKYVENIINHSNLINMYTFLKVREIAETANASLNNHIHLSMTKDTVIFTKSITYSKNNATQCEQIIFKSGVMKPRVYGKGVSNFLRTEEQTHKITLRYELSRDDIEHFMEMSAALLEYDICVLHNIHF